MNRIPTWGALFATLDSANQTYAMTAFWETLQTRDMAQRRQALIEALASVLKYRPQIIQRFSVEKLIDHLRRHCRTLFYPDDWLLLFRSFYQQHRSTLMVRFLDPLGIPHNGVGMISSTIEAPSAAQVLKTAEALIAEFGHETVQHYLGVLARMGDPSWAHVAEALAALTASPSLEPPSPEPVEEALPKGLVMDQFTTLDQVLIDHIVATRAEEEGALSLEALEDLIETVIALNGKRRRSVFHLGFMHALMADQALELELDRPAFNEDRRAWYLVGVLAAKTRQGDQDALRALLTKHAALFESAARDVKGPGAVMANLLLDALFDAGHFTEALTLLTGQLTADAFRLAERAYAQATELWREQQPDAALPILSLLRQRLPSCHASPEQRDELLIQVERRYGQCLQSNGDLEGARQVFEGLLDRVIDGHRAELFADLGLIAGGFRSIERLRLPERTSERESLRMALTRGEASFRSAVEHAGKHAVNACYALALRDYLEWADHHLGDEQAHARALRHVDMALAGMRESPAAPAYERMGLLGQTMFMEIILNMDNLVVGESHRALTQWERIPSGSGLFPKQDIQRLIEAAELLNPGVAAKIAESVWRKRPEVEAWELLGSSAERMIAHSPFLQDALLRMARDEHLARVLRFRIWKLLVPVLLRKQLNDEAEAGLDALETLSEDATLAAELLDWLRDPAHFDPAWSQTEADWAVVRLARAIGQDAECLHPLTALFYRLRDERPVEAMQTAQLLTEWQIDPEHGARLLTTLAVEPIEPEQPDLEQRLRAGECVRVLFIGGNETQAQYQEDICEALAAQWPGLQLEFEHTGWSANWGREVEQLVRRSNEVDAVVIMRMIRTLLGRRLRAQITKPWIACTGTGRRMMLESLRKAALVGLSQRPSS